ncbi:hypothetical protein KH5_02170 [Urechidicola sp. KH5]
MKTLTLFVIGLCFIATYSQTIFIPDNNFEQSLIDLGYDTTLDDYVSTASISSITTLSIAYRNIDNLEGLEYFTNLEVLLCQNNNLTDLDVTQNTALRYLDCSGNNISSLDVSQNLLLEELYCSSNDLETLNVSSNSSLHSLFLISNDLESLNLQNGNNHNMSFTIANNNNLLGCVDVDVDGVPPSNSIFDGGIVFSDDCAALQLSVQDFEINQTKIYPNPTKSSFKIQVAPSLEYKLLEIHNQLGRKIGTTKELFFDMDNIASGLYIISIQTDKGVFSKKLVKI